MANVNRDLFERVPVPQAACKLMVPTIIGSLVMVLYNLADTLFVGMLNSETQSAAVSLAGPAMLAFNAINNLFGVGSSSLMSRALGVHDHETVTKSAAFGLWGSIISSFLLSIGAGVFLEPLMRVLGATDVTLAATRDYMVWAVVMGAVPSILNVVMGSLVRAEGSSLHASIGTMSGCLLNIILDPIFILPWGLNMGAAGAGCATFISNCCACLYFIILLRVRRDKTNIRLSPKYFGIEKRIVSGVMVVGVPAAVQNLLNVTGQTVLNNFIKDYGAAAMAAVGIAHKIYMIPMQIGFGGSQGIMPLIGYSYSSGNSKRFSESISFVRRLMLPMLTLAAVLGWIYAENLMRLFIQNEEVVAFGKLFTRGMVAGLPLMMLDFLAVGVFQSVGMGKMSFIFAILRKVVLEIPATLILNALFHEQGIAYCGTVAEVVLSIVGTVMIAHIVRDVQKRDGIAMNKA